MALSTGPQTTVTAGEEGIDGGDLIMTAGCVVFHGDLVAASSGAVTDGNNATVTIIPANAEPTGHSHVMTFTSGPTTSGNTAAVQNSSGTGLEGTRGGLNLTVGSGNTGEGGPVKIATGDTRGSVSITRGESTATTSGAITIRSPNTGTEDVSGAIVLGLKYDNLRP